MCSGKSLDMESLITRFAEAMAQKAQFECDNFKGVVHIWPHGTRGTKTRR